MNNWIAPHTQNTANVHTVLVDIMLPNTTRPPVLMHQIVTNKIARGSLFQINKISRRYAVVQSNIILYTALQRLWQNFIRSWTRKRHAIPCPHRWPMECLLSHWGHWWRGLRPTSSVITGADSSLVDFEWKTCLTSVEFCIIIVLNIISEVQKR